MYPITEFTLKAIAILIVSVVRQENCLAAFSLFQVRASAVGFWKITGSQLAQG